MLQRSSSNPVLGSLIDQELSLRRTQSEVNLSELLVTAAAEAAASERDEFHNPQPKSLWKSFRRTRSSMLETAPSFSAFFTENYLEEQETEHEENRAVRILEKKATFSFEENLDFITEAAEVEEEREISKELMSYSGNDEEGRPKSPPMFMARGLGVDVGFGGVGADFSQPEYGEGDWDTAGMGEYFKKMVDENPGNTLFLRNYAQFLYQAKGDLPGAEEYYSRVILLEPGDGEMLSQYAKIVWQLHRDHKKASRYYERSVQVAPSDCHIHAAYASFLWETEFEDEQEEDGFPQDLGEPLMFWNRTAEEVKVSV
ncbi:hypothetical protein ACHQM5_014248 [Ranunculus cassubicifolius]